MLRPPSSTYLPRPSDIEFRSKLPEAASIPRVVGSMTNGATLRPSPPNRPLVSRPAALLTTDDSIARSEWPDDTRADTPRPCHWSAPPDGWYLEGFTDWRPLWNAQEGCAAARTCVIRRLDRRRGSITRDVTIISIVCTTTFYHHRSFPIDDT